MFHSLQGSDSNAAVIVEASRAFFQSCVFRDLMEAYRDRDITPTRWEHITGTFDAADANSTLALSNCTLTELYGAAAIVVDDDAQVYSDNALHEVSSQPQCRLRFPVHTPARRFQKSQSDDNLLLPMASCMCAHHNLSAPRTTVRNRTRTLIGDWTLLHG